MTLFTGLIFTATAVLLLLWIVVGIAGIFRTTER